jgi:nitrogen regulatory protein P-II 1
MKKVEAIIPSVMLEDLKDRLTLVGVRGMTISLIRIPAGALFSLRTRLIVVTTDDMVETILNAVFTVARRSGHDGQIRVIPVDEVIRIRTGEHGPDAL